MLTKNFYAMMITALGQTASTVTDRNNEIRDTNFYHSYWAGIFTNMNNYDTTSSTQCVELGTGTTPVTVNDYKLESKIDSGITVTVPNAVTTEYTDSHISWTVTLGVLASEEITISEIGLRSRAVTTSTGTGYYVLVDRTVLDTPVTIPAGQSKQITYTIRFNYGDAV